jgi:SnoaL-like domain
MRSPAADLGSAQNWKDDDDMPLEALDFFAIQNLINSYPYLLDRGDFDGVGRLLGHAKVHSGGSIMADKDPAAIAASFRDWLYTYQDGSPRTRHCLANLIIAPESDIRAVVQSYVMVFQQTQALALQPIIGGDYRDIVEKVDNSWRIVERRMGNDLIGDLSAHGRDSSIIRPMRANG